MSFPISAGTATQAAPPAQASAQTQAPYLSPDGRHCCSPSPLPPQEQRLVSPLAQAGGRAPGAQAANASAGDAARGMRFISVPQLLLPRLAGLVRRGPIFALVCGPPERPRPSLGGWYPPVEGG